MQKNIVFLWVVGVLFFLCACAEPNATGLPPSPSLFPSATGNATEPPAGAMPSTAIILQTLAPTPKPEFYRGRFALDGNAFDAPFPLYYIGKGSGDSKEYCRYYEYGTGVNYTIDFPARWEYSVSHIPATESHEAEPTRGIDFSFGEQGSLCVMQSDSRMTFDRWGYGSGVFETMYFELAGGTLLELRIKSTGDTVGFCGLLLNLDEFFCVVGGMGADDWNSEKTNVLNAIASFSVCHERYANGYIPEKLKGFVAP